MNPNLLTRLVAVFIGVWLCMGGMPPIRAQQVGNDPNPAARGTRRTVTVFVELEGDPTAAMAAGRRGLRLAEAAPTIRATAARLVQQQEALMLPMAALGGEVLARFTRVANGLRVRIPEDQVERLAALPGVRRVQPVRLYHRHLTTSTPFVGAPVVWATPPTGVDGRGLKIGIIDSGIDYTHADFGGGGTVADFAGNDPTRIEPGSFPTAKVVAGFDFAGDAYNPNDHAHETPIPDNDPLDCATNGHGTHVAGIAAGLGVLSDGTTYRSNHTSALDFSAFRVAPGIAPGASLVALKVFGCDGSTALITDALEWAADPNQDQDFSDRLDVVNLSLGGDFGILDPEDSDLRAANRLAELGCVVVCSAGNNENIFFAVGAPGVASRAISVANSVSKGEGKALAVLEPLAIAGNYFMVEGSLTPSLSNAPPVTGRLVSVEPNLACDDLTDARALSGRIALIDRGTCLFAEKILRVQAAGAIAVVMVNNLDTAPIPMGGDSAGIRIPGVMISKADGERLRQHLGAELIVRLDAALTVERPEFVDSLDDGSSRGPGSPDSSLKPDISAPGAGIVSAKAGSGAQGVAQSGTSMSAPMVSGAAALLRQRHPDWSVEQLKAALMNTAKPLRSPEGAAYPESRMGAGRLQVDRASRAQVLAFAEGAEGRVGVSFGSWIVTGSREETRAVRLVNHGDRDVTFRVVFSNSVEQAGVRFIPVDPVVTVPARGTAVTGVRLLANPEAFDPRPDATTAAVIGSGSPLPRHFLNEASGQLWFLGSSLFKNDLLTGLESGTGSPQRHRGTEERDGPLSTLCLRASVVETPFMERPLLETDLLTGLEPGIPGGETPPSTAGGTPAATEARFMESGVGAGAMLTDLEPEAIPGGETPAATEVRFRGSEDSLHVPCYASVRAASDFQVLDRRIRIATRESTKLRPELTFHFGGRSLSTNLLPIVSAFELGESSPDKQITDPNRAALDLLAVGAATDIASVSRFGESSLYFGIVTAGAWTTPQPVVAEFQVLIDRNGDGWEDFVVFNGNGASTNTGGAQDAFMTIVLGLSRDLDVVSTNAVAFVNQYGADEWDTAVFNNSVLVLPVPTAAIGLSQAATSFRYKVRTFGQSGNVDRTGWIPFDAARPVIDTAFASPDGTPMHDDGFPLTVRLDREAARTAGQRLPAVLLLHHFGSPEARFEIVTLDLENDDSDNDRLPDWWEQRHFSGIQVAGRDTDSDGDGASDHAELVAGTNPNDARSAFRMRSAVRVSSRNIAVRWTGSPGQVFALERSTNLVAGFTEVVRDDIQSTPPLNSITDTNAPDPGPYFYRVRLKN
jgi:subtilisin family serine protease